MKCINFVVEDDNLKALKMKPAFFAEMIRLMLLHKNK